MASDTKRTETIRAHKRSKLLKNRNKRVQLQTKKAAAKKAK